MKMRPLQGLQEKKSTDVILKDPINITEIKKIWSLITFLVVIEFDLKLISFKTLVKTQLTKLISLVLNPKYFSVVDSVADKYFSDNLLVNLK